MYWITNRCVHCITVQSSFKTHDWFTGLSFFRISTQNLVWNWKTETKYLSSTLNFSSDTYCENEWYRNEIWRESKAKFWVQWILVVQILYPGWFSVQFVSPAYLLFLFNFVETVQILNRQEKVDDDSCNNEIAVPQRPLNALLTFANQVSVICMMRAAERGRFQYVMYTSIVWFWSNYTQ